MVWLTFVGSVAPLVRVIRGLHRSSFREIRAFQQFLKSWVGSQIMRGGKSAGCLDRDLQNLYQLHPRGDALAQSISVDKLSRDKTRGATCADFVDGDDVGMIQRRSRLCFLNKAPHPRLISSDVVR